MREHQRPDVVQDLNDRYPLVALKSIVAFPHNRQALPIAREKTIRAIEEAMMQPKHILVAMTQRSIEIDNPQPKISMKLVR